MDDKIIYQITYNHSALIIYDCSLMAFIITYSKIYLKVLRELFTLLYWIFNKKQHTSLENILLSSKLCDFARLPGKQTSVVSA